MLIAGTWSWFVKGLQRDWSSCKNCVEQNFDLVLSDMQHVFPILLITKTRRESKSNQKLTSVKDSHFQILSFYHFIVVKVHQQHYNCLIQQHNYSCFNIYGLVGWNVIRVIWIAFYNNSHNNQCLIHIFPKHVTVYK